MQSPSTVLAQITSTLFPAEFSRCVESFPTRRPPRGLSPYDQFLALVFGQLTYRESLRDIVCCLQAKQSLLYHLGFRGHISRTNLAYANHHRDWRLFQAVAQILMRRAARLYQDDWSDPDWRHIAFALDSSMISLSLDLFPWGYYARSQKAAMKLHLMLSLQGNLPAWATLTEADFPDMKVLDEIPVAPGAYYVMDRGYVDFLRLFRLHRTGAFFVVRNRRDVKLRVLSRRPVDKSTGLHCDQMVRLASRWSWPAYPETLRKIRYHDGENQVTLILLTNQFDVPALLLTELYRKRWQVELFFKWIKQHLRLRSFYGRSPNAVRAQVWSAICAYLMVAIVKKQMQIPKTLNEILQVLSVSVFEQVPLEELLKTNQQTQNLNTEREQSQNFLLFSD